MKNLFQWLNPYLFFLAVLLNGVVIYQKLIFLNENSKFNFYYLISLIVVILFYVFVKNQSWRQYLEKITLWVHLIFHGVFLVTFPIGMIFALIGSYLLAAKVFFFFYLPSALLFLFNFYLVKFKRKETKIID